MSSKNIILEISDQKADQLIDLLQKAIRGDFTTKKQETFSSGKKYLTISELSEYIHMPINTIYQKTCNNLIPFIKRGRTLLFERERIDIWLSESENKPFKK